MDSKESIAVFLRKNTTSLIFFVVIFFVLAYSFSTLTTKPKIWVDESVSIDIARSFMNYGVLSPQTAPGVFYPLPHLIQPSGYPLTLSLSGFFSIFGYGFFQARIFMLLWIIAALAVIFFLGKKIFSAPQALFGLLLIASFASFYGSGRTVVGDIPGFVFFLIGFWLILRERIFWGGVILGLAVVTKLSAFGLIIPVFFLVWAFKGREGWRKLLLTGAGMIGAALVWIVLFIPDPFSGQIWQGLGNFFNNPYSSSVSENVLRNAGGFFHSTTLLYFSFFFLIIFVARRFVGDAKVVFLYNFTLLYSVFAFLYYLRSPGWLRYILIAELLILFLLPHAITLLSEHLRQLFPHLPAWFSTFALSFLVILQTAQMFTSAQIFYGDGAIKAADYINSHFPEASVGILDTADVAVLLNTEWRFYVLGLTGMSPLGENPLFQKELPDVIVARKTSFFEEGKAVIDTRYALVDTVGGYPIYRKLP